MFNEITSKVHQIWNFGSVLAAFWNLLKEFDRLVFTLCRVYIQEFLSELVSCETENNFNSMWLRYILFNH